MYWTSFYLFFSSVWHHYHTTFLSFLLSIGLSSHSLLFFFFLSLSLFLRDFFTLFPSFVPSLSIHLSVSLFIYLFLLSIFPLSFQSTDILSRLLFQQAGKKLQFCMTMNRNGASLVTLRLLSVFLEFGLVGSFECTCLFKYNSSENIVNKNWKKKLHFADSALFCMI